MADRPKTKGTSLAKGPAGLIGLLLLIYGITPLIFDGHSFTQHVPNGTVHGKSGWKSTAGASCCSWPVDCCWCSDNRCTRARRACR